MRTKRAPADDDVIHVLRRRIADKFAADLSVIVGRLRTSHAGRPVDRVLDELAEQVRSIGVEPDREALRPHAVLISNSR